MLLTFALLPSIWLSTTGTILSPNGVARISPGVSFLRGPNNTTMFSFDGRESGIALPDAAALSTARSLTVAAWVYLREYPSYAGEIVFRGDDRDGMDSFNLVVMSNGSAYFGIGDAEGRGANVHTGPLPLNQWVHLTGIISDLGQDITIYLNGKIAQRAQTNVRPLGTLDDRFSPGIGIGNVQNIGRHNQPFAGNLADVRVYPFEMAPQDAGYRPDWPSARFRFPEG